ncbi:SMP-30/gluconolactonase/LRE family protein [Bremerella alba]|uniref:6-deoxy-6-sulfogluconolactonase n=1 Tax=Bremerella alba TaxID=980252 RepID=A0A7V8V5U4_9BACT|nr:SMP-30/gluconolactonase/LRE family protein [Bremerella alba]MBA2115519.1 6-deoxy-6-sulfogluconolactonase [Bremerella alba]
MQTYEAQCVLDIQATLGEGPSWDATTGKLLWVDIENSLVNRFDPESGKNEAWTVEKECSFAIASSQGDIVVGTREGIVRLNPQTGEIAKVANPDTNSATTRFNDAKCDPRGRLFAGTISDTRTPGDANCYRFDSQFNYETVVPGVVNSNGLCWSPDHKLFYYIDTATRKIDAFDYDIETGHISNRRMVVDIPESLGIGKPDGMTIDAEGMLWTGMWGGAAVCRWDPRSGELLGKIEIPCPNVTSCCFGGENLDQLYIATPRKGLSDEQLKQFPQAGGIFRCQPGLNGAATFPFAG